MTSLFDLANDQPTKKCHWCQQRKTLDQFKASGKGRCRECDGKVAKEKCAHAVGQAATMLADCKKRATRKGIACTIDANWIWQRIKKGVCEVTGTPFELSARNGRTNRRMLAPSLDRIDSTKGYTPDNCRVVVYVYNAAKNASSHAVVLRMAKHLVAKQLTNDE